MAWITQLVAVMPRGPVPSPKVKVGPDLIDQATQVHFMSTVKPVASGLTVHELVPTSVAIVGLATVAAPFLS